METGRFWPICFFGARNAQKRAESVSEQCQEIARICLGAARNQPELVWEQPEKSQNLSGREHNMLRINLGEARKRSTNGMNKGKNDQNWSGKERKNRRKARRARYRRKGGGFRVFTLYIALPRTRGPGLALTRTCSRLWCCVRASTIFRGRHVARDGAGRKSSEVRLGRRRCRAAALRPQFRV